MGGSRLTFDVPGTASPVRFPASEPHRFVIRLTMREADPSATLRLVPMQAAQAGRKQARAGAPGVRQAIWMDQRGMFGNVNVDPTMGAMPILAKPFGESSLELRPESDLALGEYAVLLPGSMTAFCFAIDAASEPAARE